MKQHSQISAFILCGGSSSRMGRDKASLMFAGEPLLLRTVRLLEPRVAKVAIVGRRGENESLGITTIQDLQLGAGDEQGKPLGPLAGIATALASSQTPWNLILACDLPYLTAEWLDWLLGRAVKSAAHIIMPRTSRGMEPLAALYRRECGATILGLLERGIRKVTDALAPFQIEFVSENDWRDRDPSGRVLCNMNTPEDYEVARTWLENP